MGALIFNGWRPTIAVLPQQVGATTAPVRLGEGALAGHFGEAVQD